MLSLIKPSSYLLYPYSKARSVDTIIKLLSLQKIDVISAPVTTILGWADLSRFKRGLKKSLSKDSEIERTDEINRVIKKIDESGLNAVSRQLQAKLSNLMSAATLIFSTSSITEKEWRLIRKFMGWKKGEERFTNLYVSSEIGPFAADIRKEPSDPILDGMYVFPLTIPSLEFGGRNEKITNIKNKRGRLLVSRIHSSDPIINIDTGDIIKIIDTETLPRIDGTILRDTFPLKSGLKLSKKIGIQEEYEVYVGNYFNLKGLELINPRIIFSCLSERCEIDDKYPAILIPKLHGERVVWLMMIRGKNKVTTSDIVKTVISCPNGEIIKNAIQKQVLQIELSENDFIETKIKRSELYNLIKIGKSPKGLLKKWPLYLINPTEQSFQSIIKT